MQTNQTLAVLGTLVLSASAIAGGADLEPIGPTPSLNSHAGEAMDIRGNLLAVGERVAPNYVVMFYEHQPEGWQQSQAVSVGSRRAVSLAFGDGFVGAALSGSGALAGVVIEPSQDGWAVSAELANPDTSRFNNFTLAAAGDETVFISCNDGSQQYRDAVLVYERGKGGWNHVQTLAPAGAACTFFGEDIDAEGDMLVVGATGILSCSGGAGRGAYVFLRQDGNWNHVDTLTYGNGNGAWVACDGEYVLSWAYQSGPNSTVDYIRAWKREGESFTSAGSINGSSGWGFDLDFSAGITIKDGVVAFGSCDGFWGCLGSDSDNRTVRFTQWNGSNWENWNRPSLTIPAGYASSGFGRGIRMGGGSVVIGAPDYANTRGLMFEMPLGGILNCPADLNSSGAVDGGDLGELFAQWGGSGRADLNGDSTVDAADLGLMLSMWSDC